MGRTWEGFGTDGTEWLAEATLAPCKQLRQQVRIGRVGHSPLRHGRVEMLDLYRKKGFCKASPSLNTTIARDIWAYPLSWNALLHCIEMGDETGVGSSEGQQGQMVENGLKKWMMAPGKLRARGA
ncbi:hypothetical protein DFJ58DRAFT_840476 [Suillus subalutaceus]|uniref:uncharacterized protein n=1 Tax=Suillus subalutaceus TaxID=48586 RepID=UPI001B872929|nr:uncharacterized protein DFJ58DRAFT_840476 [Suillus subalutaceus]KAG1858462.1 hypothetical protein DFJ58DRAFT_840476 [Suillus subalutaceus]